MTKSWPGNYICLEGPDGSGKSTIWNMLLKDYALGNLSMVDRHARVETAGIELACEGKQADPVVMALLKAASIRWGFQRVVLPRLLAGATVLEMRGAISTMVYGGTTGVHHDLMHALKDELPSPDVVIILWSSSPLRTMNSDEPFEVDSTLQQRVRQNYWKLRDEDWVKFIETSQHSVEETFQQVKDILLQYV